MEFSVEWHDRLGSTNQHMKTALISGHPLADGTVVAAREQTAGRGRQDRKWMAPADGNLCFSLFAATDAPLAHVPALTMAAALAVNDLLRSHGIRSAPKWPNDVLVNGRKICGILSERVEPPPPQKPGIIVGIGLNINLSTAEAEAIGRPATSMLIETERAFDPAGVLEDLLPRLAYWIDRWENGGFQALEADWSRRSGPVGKTLTVHDGALIKSGRLAGYGPHGELLLETESGVETIWSGDVH